MPVPVVKLFQVNTALTFDITSLIFGSPSNISMLITAPNFEPGPYKLWVENGFGPSNQVDLQIYKVTQTDPTVVPNTTVEQSSLARVVEQYALKDRVKNLIKAYISGQIQDLETVFNELLYRLNLQAAVGVQLDQIGTILNTPRNGVSDTVYRLILKGRIAATISKGKIGDIAFTYAQLTGAFQINVTEGVLASVSIESSTAPIPGTETIVRSILEDAIGLGIGFDGVVTNDPENGFRFSDAVTDNDPPVFSATHGFGDVNLPGQGGKYQKVVF